MCVTGLCNSHRCALFTVDAPSRPWFKVAMTSGSAWTSPFLFAGTTQTGRMCVDSRAHLRPSECLISHGLSVAACARMLCYVVQVLCAGAQLEWSPHRSCLFRPIPGSRVHGFLPRQYVRCVRASMCGGGLGGLRRSFADCCVLDSTFSWRALANASAVAARWCVCCADDQLCWPNRADSLHRVEQHHLAGGCCIHCCGVLPHLHRVNCCCKRRRHQSRSSAAAAGHRQLLCGGCVSQHAKRLRVRETWPAAMGRVRTIKRRLW